MDMGISLRYVDARCEIIPWPTHPPNLRNYKYASNVTPNTAIAIYTLTKIKQPDQSLSPLSPNKNTHGFEGVSLQIYVILPSVSSIIIWLLWHT